LDFNFVWESVFFLCFKVQQGPIFGREKSLLRGPIFGRNSIPYWNVHRKYVQIPKSLLKGPIFVRNFSPDGNIEKTSSRNKIDGPIQRGPGIRSCRDPKLQNRMFPSYPQKSHTGHIVCISTRQIWIQESSFWDILYWPQVSNKLGRKNTPSPVYAHYPQYFQCTNLILEHRGNCQTPNMWGYWNSEFCDSSEKNYIVSNFLYKNLVCSHKHTPK